jgi:hypothetical protein
MQKPQINNKSSPNKSTSDSEIELKITRQTQTKQQNKSHHRAIITVTKATNKKNSTLTASHWALLKTSLTAPYWVGSTEV